MPLGARTRATTPARRLRIVEAALPVFGAHGYEAVSVEMLCHAAQVSVGSLYHHFENKAGVAAAVYAEAIHRYHEPLLDVVVSGPSAEVGIRSMVGAHQRWVVGHADWARFMVTMGGRAEIRAQAADHQEANARLVTAVMAWAEPHMASGALVTLPPAAFLAVLFGPSYFHTLGSLSRSADEPDEAPSASLADAAWRSLRGPETTLDRNGE